MALVIEQHDLNLGCSDGFVLKGHLWTSDSREARALVVINPATGVRARYYHYFARFLAERGFDVLTYDYRGIGASRPASLRGFRAGWHDWGALDTDAALMEMARRAGGRPLLAVGHSIGGMLLGFAPRADRINRALTVGAQFAWCGDYARRALPGFLVKWHVAMPLLTKLNGYFPGKRLGWLEDLPAGVVHDWAFRTRRVDTLAPEGKRDDFIERIGRFSAPILAVVVSDDTLATRRGVRRALDYYRGAARTMVEIRPADYGLAGIGHFDLFHARHERGFWTETLSWLSEGRNPWPDRVLA